MNKVCYYVDDSTFNELEWEQTGLGLVKDEIIGATILDAEEIDGMLGGVLLYIRTKDGRNMVLDFAGVYDDPLVMHYAIVPKGA